MVVGTALEWSNAATVALPFPFDYALTMRPLLHSGLALAAALRLALATDAVSNTIMWIVDNAVMLLIPGAMHAGLSSLLFSGSLAIAGLAAFPANRWLIIRG